jgi:hypothetical protein
MSRTEAVPPMLAKDSGRGPTEGPGCVEAVRAGESRGVKRSYHYDQEVSLRPLIAC